MNEPVWATCPACKRKTRLKLRPDTQLRNFLLFCPKCRREMLVDVEGQRIVRARSIPA